MRWTIALLLYRLLLPLLFLAAFPGWVLKMLRRDGMGSGLLERIGIYTPAREFEPCGAIHVHSVSVGETLLALKLIREWRKKAPEQDFVVAVGTATGHHIASAAGIGNLRTTYAPLDFRWMVRSYLNRFEPARIVLVEGEAWPHLLLACETRGIEVTLVNARVSPRSARRFRRFAPWIRPLYSRLRGVAIQELEDAGLWRELGILAEHIQHTGSLKFDPGSGDPPRHRDEFTAILDAYPDGRPVVLAASTHPGEHAWIASALRERFPGTIIAIAPRHAERRLEVKQ
ncbi:MAG: glycosyltransferase N-terminal domain-containing protein, partial [Akkermansiaceae bacterium]|nr:glycosyltransferase N-terminal domain-containing protein [Akkermansiaceae bacterium]